MRELYLRHTGGGACAVGAEQRCLASPHDRDAGLVQAPFVLSQIAGGFESRVTSGARPPQRG